MTNLAEIRYNIMPYSFSYVLCQNAEHNSGIIKHNKVQLNVISPAYKAL